MNTARSIILMPVIAAAAAVVLSSEPRLISYEPLADPAWDEWCDWDSTAEAGSDARRRAAARFQAGQAGEQRANISCAAEGCAGVTARTPLRFVQDPYPEFSAVFVDADRNEVVLADENRFHILVYDRLTNTPPSAPQSDPKRLIGGLKTETEYISGLYVDPTSGDIYAANNDTVHDLAVFSRKAEGDVHPDRLLVNPYGSFGLAVDEAKQELFVTVQHDSAVMVFPKMAGGNTPPLRLLQGDRTRLGDPHGIAFDPKNRLIYVTNYGTSRQAVAGSLGPNESTTIPRIANWPAGNLMPYSYRHEIVYGTGRFNPPSITVYSADARGNTAPLRVIEGPRTQLSWPTGVAVDPEHGEVYVANDTGHSVTVFSAAAQGDVAPLRVLKGPRALVKNPLGVFVDLVNDELWVANYGNHMAPVFKRTASGDAAPLRVIRSAPLDAPATQLSNPFGAAYDSRREEILAPNCVGRPRIGVFARTADKNALPVRTIEGQRTHLNRTVHSIGYDEIHDEIVVQSNIGQAILTFRGGASGDEAPIRVIQGPKTLLRDPEKITLDAVHNEIFVFNMSIRDSVLVFDRLANGDVPPKRILRGPATLLGASAGAVDPVRNLLVVNGSRGLLIFDRTAEGNTKPLRIIGGPKSGLRGGGLTTVYPPTGKILLTAGGGEQSSDASYAAIWNIDDNGDVPPQWTIGGPKGVLRRPHGIAVNAKEKTVIITDKYVNAVLTYSVPEMFDEANRSRQTAQR